MTDEVEHSEESANIIQKDGEYYHNVPDGATEPTRTQPKRKYGEKTVKGIIVGQGDNKRVIPLEEVKKLAQLHLSYTDMAEYFGVKLSTFKDHFHSVCEREKQKTKQRLMYAMLQNATEKMNPTIQIWLSKNLLGFTDQPINSNEDKVLPWLDEE